MLCGQLAFRACAPEITRCNTFELWLDMPITRKRYANLLHEEGRDARDRIEAVLHQEYARDFPREDLGRRTLCRYLTASLFVAGGVLLLLVVADQLLAVASVTSIRELLP